MGTDIKRNVIVSYICFSVFICTRLVKHSSSVQSQNPIFWRAWSPSKGNDVLGKHHCWYTYIMLMQYVSDSKSALHGSLGIRNHLPGDLWFHFCNDYFEFWCFATNNYRTSL